MLMLDGTVSHLYGGLVEWDVLFVHWPRAIAEIPVFIPGCLPALSSFCVDEIVSFMLGFIYSDSWLGFK